MGAVGERALAAVRTESGVERYHAHWGGGDDRLGRVLAGPPDAALRALATAAWQPRGSAEGPFDRLDYLGTDVVYLVSGRGVTVLLPVWAGFGADPTAGVLVRVETVAGCRALRAACRFCRDLFHEALARDLLDPALARALFALAVGLLAPRGRVHTGRGEREMGRL